MKLNLQHFTSKYWRPGHMSQVYVVNSSPSKPISAWTQADLCVASGGHISLGITYQDEFSFFGTTPTPSLALSSDFLTCSDAEDALEGDKAPKAALYK